MSIFNDTPTAERGRRESFPSLTTAILSYAVLHGGTVIRVVPTVYVTRYDIHDIVKQSATPPRYDRLYSFVISSFLKL